MTDLIGTGSATIADVARIAGVSRAAVSKVLRNAYGVSPSMKTRVTAAIDELHYRPRVAARAMRGRTFTIGLEIPDFGNQFFSKVLSGAAGALAGSGYQLVIAPADDGPEEGRRALQALVDRQVDALVAVSPRVGQDELERIARSTPVVMFGRHDLSDAYDTVAGDDEAGARAVMSHLLDLGHERIAHLTRAEIDEEHEKNTPHGVRLRVYLEMMREAGLDRYVEVRRTGEGQDFADRVARDLLQVDPAPTAIFAGHDELAIGALKAAIDVDADVSIAGYDGVPIASHPAISLTTASQPGEEMGYRAMTMLLERLDGREDARHEVFAPVLDIRGSTRPPVTAGP